MTDWLDRFGEELVHAARRDELPSIDAFGQRLVARARVPRRRLRTVAVGIAVALPLAATSGAATAVVLRETVVQPPDPASVPDEQTPLAGTAVVSSLRAADPGNELPWTIRVAKSKTGFTCTTVGQVEGSAFGLTGLDGVFRRLPAEFSDACGQGGTLTGARIVAGDRLEEVRSIVYGVAPGLRTATLTTATARRALAVGPGGTFVAALRGYPEDHTAGVTLTFANRTERHNFGADGTIPDPGGAQAWAVERYTLGTRLQCSHVRQARRSAGVGFSGDEGPPYPVGPARASPPTSSSPGGPGDRPPRAPRRARRLCRRRGRRARRRAHTRAPPADREGARRAARAGPAADRGARPEDRPESRRSRERRGLGDAHLRDDLPLEEGEGDRRPVLRDRAPPRRDVRLDRRPRHVQADAARPL
jgi:hypothetical protein